MGWWNNTVFVASGDVEAVGAAIAGLSAPAEPVVAAVFAGAPGWAVVKTWPLEALVIEAARSELPLAELSAALGCVAFAYSAYDGDSHALLEVGPDGARALSGYCSQEPGRFWGRPEDIDPARLAVRFDLVDVRAVAAAVGEAAGEVRGVLAGALPTAPAIAKALAARRDKVVAWIDGVGGETESRPVCGRPYTLWRAGAAQLVAALAGPEPPPVGVEETGRALLRVFGGVNAEACDNGTSAVGLVEGGAIEVEGVLFRSSAPAP